MTCAELREAASAALDGEATPAAEARTHQHLRKCAACREEREQDEVLGYALRLTTPPRATDAARDEAALATLRREGCCGDARVLRPAAFPQRVSNRLHPLRRALAAARRARMPGASE